MYNKINLKEAANDLRYLLNRRYNRKSAIELVGNRWNLNHDERHILYRTVFSYDELKARTMNEVKIEEIKGKIVSIDTYNILITIESCLKGLLILAADDGYIRDISQVYNKFKPSIHTISIIQTIIKHIKPYQPKSVLFYLDQSISKSGELAAKIRNELERFKLEGNADTVPSSDQAVIANGEIVISNDRIVLENSVSHLNLISLIIEDLSPSEINLLNIL